MQGMRCEVLLYAKRHLRSNPQSARKLEQVESMTKTITQCDVNTCKKEINTDVYRTTMLGKSYDLCPSCYEAFKGFIERRMSGGKEVATIPYTATLQSTGGTGTYG